MFQFLGLLAALLTTGAYIPQAYKTIKTKSTQSLALSTYFMLLAGTILWVVYAVHINDIPVMLANTVTAVLSAIILFLKVASQRSSKQ